MLLSLFPFHGLTWPAAALIALVYFALAIVVSAHVLLRKADVRAALGWIGITWLVPLAGGLLYYLFGINRVTRRALRLHRLEQEPVSEAGAAGRPRVPDLVADLAAIGGRLNTSPLTAGNRIQLLHGGDEAYPAMLEAISAARRSIALTSYIFRDDRTGRQFTDALARAHRRGVAVRVLIDGIGGGYFWSPAWRRLRAEGVPAARFLHTYVPWRMPFLNMRSHKKLLVIDGHIGFAGGLNIGDENLSSFAPSHDRVDDFHARLEGPVVRQIMDSIARDWNFATGEVLEGELWWPQIAPAGPVFARGVRSGPDADLYRAETLFGAALGQARTRIRIATPYFLPDERLLFAIHQAQLRGVDVKIFVPARTDYRPLDWAIRAHLRFFRQGLSSIAFTPAPFEHAKLMTVDEEFCCFGSSNWDTRSLRLNFEFDLECYDRALTTQINAELDRMEQSSTLLDREALLGAPLPERLRDAAMRLLVPYL
ncbi:MAG: PLDc N-terminal domain-containing protein [Alphaproteobacteria bacterium]|nr:PLDc N-terminal domain-containing protein [Alphaproteobacteria bacterium]